MIDLKEAVTALVKNKVDFVIVGGVAINLHSSAYITRDLDFCYSRSRENITRLFSALAPFSPRARELPKGLPFVFDETTLMNGTNFTFETTIGDIDLLGDYSDAIRRSVTYEIYGAKVKVLDLNALIDTKTAADRPKDHLVLPELLALREALDPNEE